MIKLKIFDLDRTKLIQHAVDPTGGAVVKLPPIFFPN